jgi:hypothetical protein
MADALCGRLAVQLNPQALGNRPLEANMTDVAKIAEGLSEAQRAALDALGFEIKEKKQ